MVPLFHRNAHTIIRLDKKTAFYSALSLNLFFIVVVVIILIYSYYMGENVGELFADSLSDSFYYVKSLVSFVVNTLMLYLFFRIEFWILNRHSDGRKRLYLFLLFLLPLVCIVSTLVSQITGIWMKGILTGYQYSIIHFIKDLILFFASTFVTYLIYLLNSNQERIEENKNLTIENLKNRYNALKSQTDPHFLFNSLNSLNGLIGYDNDRAHEYLMQLSSVFRYTMQERLVVKLSDELEYTNSYIYLMKIRHGEALIVTIDIKETHQDYYILPSAIQTLVENAIKHNVVSLQKPLNLRIEMSVNDSIIVENNIQPRLKVREGNGVGLSNLNERYWLMFRENIHIEVTDTFFRVEVPLIKNIDMYNKRIDIQGLKDSML